MSSKSPGYHTRRSDLFVVRIWREDPTPTAAVSHTDNTEGNDIETVRHGQRQGRWRGKIQRAVSGEEHQFQGWPALIEVLEGMLSDARHVSERDRNRPPNSNKEEEG